MTVSSTWPCRRVRTLATALSIAVKEAIEANWAVPTGGAKPTVYGTEVSNRPTSAEWIRLLGPSYGMDQKRRTDAAVKQEHFITLRVSTHSHTDLESRLDEMINEIYRIITPSTVTGFHEVDIIRQRRSSSDLNQAIWEADLTIQGLIKSTASAVTPGTTTTSDFLVDTLEFTGGGGKINVFLDDDTMAGDDADGLASQQSIKAYVDAQGMIGSAYAAWQLCTFYGATLIGKSKLISGFMSNVDANADQTGWLLPLPRLKDTLKLYITGLRTLVFDADATNYVNAVKVYGMNETGVTTTILDEGTNRTTQGDFETALGDTDVSAYDFVYVLFFTVVADVNALDYGPPLLLSYYA